MLRTETADRVRLLTFDRPEALNAFSEALYDAVTDALIEAASDPAVAVVVFTGRGRAYSAGADLGEMAARAGEDFPLGRHGFPGFIKQLTDFPKPLLMAVNGLAVGIGATMLGYADLAFMAATARLRCPFTNLGLAPEAASSALFPLLAGRQRASWILLSSEWLTAEECREAGIVWKVVPDDELLPTTLDHARRLAAQPISSLVATKRTIVEPYREHVAAARRREDAAFAALLHGPANREALQAFAEKRPPDFSSLPAGW
jgi:enoyl-CoA hydratase/carnithine racemase